MVQKKVTPLTQTGDYDPGPALPGSPPRVLQGFLNKKQLSEQETTTAAPGYLTRSGPMPGELLSTIITNSKFSDFAHAADPFEH